MEIIYRHFETLPSTNDWAKEHLHSFPHNALTVISASAQTAGKGRQGKRWISPANQNIYATFVFFKPDPDPLLLTRLLSLSTMHVLEQYGIRCTIKPPNDLLVHQKKIAGVLCETVPPDAVIIGLGLNVNMTPDQLNQIDQPATSLLAETGKIFELTPLLCALAEHFAEALS